MVNKEPRYKVVLKEKERFEKFKKPEIALIYYVLSDLGIVMAECGTHRENEVGVSPMINAAFPNASIEELENLTIQKTLHPAADFMEEHNNKLFFEEIAGSPSKLSDWQNFGRGGLCYAYTDDEKWNSSSTFLVVPLSDSEKIAELLEIPHIEKGVTKFDQEVAKKIYSRLFWKVGLYHLPLSRLIMPRDIEADILNKSIVINAMITTPSNIEEIVKDLAFLGFNSAQFNNIRFKSEVPQEKAEEIKAFKKSIDNLAFVKFKSGGSIRMKVYLDIIDDAEERINTVNNLFHYETK